MEQLCRLTFIFLIIGIISSDAIPNLQKRQANIERQTGTSDLKFYIVSPGFKKHYNYGNNEVDTYNIVKNNPKICSLLVRFDTLRIDGTPPACLTDVLIVTDAKGQSTFCGNQDGQFAFFKFPKQGLSKISFQFRSDEKFTAAGFKIYGQQRTDGC